MIDGENELREPVHWLWHVNSTMNTAVFTTTLLVLFLHDTTEVFLCGNQTSAPLCPGAIPHTGQPQSATQRLDVDCVARNAGHALTPRQTVTTVSQWPQIHGQCTPKYLQRDSLHELLTTTGSRYIKLRTNIPSVNWRKWKKTAENGESCSVLDVDWQNVKRIALLVAFSPCSASSFILLTIHRLILNMKKLKLKKPTCNNDAFEGNHERLCRRNRYECTTANVFHREVVNRLWLILSDRSSTMA